MKLRLCIPHMWSGRTQAGSALPWASLPSTLYWTGAAAILFDMNHTNSSEAYSFVLYSLFSLTVMLISVTIATFCSCWHGICWTWSRARSNVCHSYFSSCHLQVAPRATEFLEFSGSIINSVQYFWGVSSQNPLVSNSLFEKCLLR